MTQITLTEAGLSISFVATTPGSGPGAVDQTVIDLHEARQCIEALKAWEYTLTEWLSDALGRNGIDVEGVGHVEVKRGTDRKEWDRHQLLRAVLDSHARPDPETGEVDPSDEGVAEVGGEMITCSPDLSRVLAVWNLGAPRVTALRSRSIDPDEFCASSPGKVSVVIVGEDLP